MRKREVEEKRRRGEAVNIADATPPLFRSSTPRLADDFPPLFHSSTPLLADNSSRLAVVSPLLGGLFAAAAFAAVYFLEKRRPLRRETESKPVRDVENLAIAAVGGATLALVEKPVTDALTKFVERREVGLLKIFRLPRLLETLLGVVLLDYTLYHWHVLTHKVPFLWDFHVFHHRDPDLDASTALRFHVGELVVSVAWRAAQIVVIGVSPEALKLWQSLLLPAILFHHSNLELGAANDAALSNIVVTPRLHGIHHSVVRSETDSNFSTIFSVWDRLHGTYRDDVPQDAIVIGAPEIESA